MKSKAKLHLVADEPVNIAELIRADAEKRDWDAVMIAADRSKPVELPTLWRRWRPFR